MVRSKKEWHGMMCAWNKGEKVKQNQSIESTEGFEFEKRESLRQVF